jgi:pyruvate kinase
MNYKIIATLGPSSKEGDTWVKMLAAGVTCFRLNTSHLALEQLLAWLEDTDHLFARLETRPNLVLDLQGSKWRLGQLEPRELIVGEHIELFFGSKAERSDALPVPHADFFQAAEISNGEIILNDAKARLTVVDAGQESLHARVLQGGPVAAHKGITLAKSNFRKEALSEKDRAILDLTRHLPGIRYAISYVKDGGEMATYRSLCGASAYLAAKLERESAMDEASLIAHSADELWLCRGDLGAELGETRMAEAVYGFSTQLSTFSIPVYLAGQVFEHMVAQPTPTRSEVCYIYEALQKGFSGLILSDETAIGRYPLESCRAAAQFLKS